ncbi:MAG: 2-C-methyl-D-erythritol 4-phosphate cytidylyltransferase [Clostridia bacterium]
MNIALILSSGVGSRVGANIPKQYLMINNKEVISYVIDTVKATKKIDKIIIVATPPYTDIIKEKYNMETTEGGNTRNESFRKGVDYIKKNYSCDRLLVVDAVRPFLTSDYLDSLVSRIEEGYDISVTTSKITNSLCSKDFHICDRDRYFLTASPMGFEFNILDKYLDGNSTLVEVLHMMPENLKIYYDYSFRRNFKLTYQEDLDFFEFLINKEK